MGKPLDRKVFCVVCGSILFVAGWVIGQQSAKNQQTVVHVVAWTVTENLTPQAMANFKRATADFAAAVPGLGKVWVGPLRELLVDGDSVRTHGLVFEFKDLQSREAYSKHPRRDQWMQNFNSVRVAGATVFDVIGE